MTKLEPLKATPYITVIEGRRPKQKAHTHLSHAKNAFDTPKLNPLAKREFKGYDRITYTHGWGTLYEFKDGEWVVLYEVPQPTEKDAYMRNGVHKTWETRPWRL